MFFIERNYKVVHLERWRQQEGWWGGTPSLGSNVALDTNFAVVSRLSNSVEVFWAGSDHALMHAYTTDDGNTLGEGPGAGYYC